MLMKIVMIFKMISKRLIRDIPIMSKKISKNLNKLNKKLICRKIIYLAKMGTNYLLKKLEPCKCLDVINKFLKKETLALFMQILSTNFNK